VDGLRTGVLKMLGFAVSQRAAGRLLNDFSTM
jgi:hypothetical protein